jgi:CspA family cold shock protein
MATGTVKWFSDAKGFGFIEPEGGGSDVFAHFSAVQMDGYRTLRQGSRVSFDLVPGPKGDSAQNIRSLIVAAEGDAPRAGTATAVAPGPGPDPGAVPLPGA